MSTGSAIRSSRPTDMWCEATDQAGERTRDAEDAEDTAGGSSTVPWVVGVTVVALIVLAVTIALMRRHRQE